ncbi:hypothetical protein L7F22_000970 [Adiantum nelumboides]|nr:hypothetical protein [Adiantum nelumboides]
MERSRESKRVTSTPRRLRISCPKDLTDAAARMDDTPLIERVKKGNFQALRASFPPASKRKRQEAHSLSEDFSESTPSVEYDDGAPQGAFNGKQRAKKDELVMNIRNIPRRARSSATRVPFASSRPLVPTSQQRSSSPRTLPTREEKLRRTGVKSRLLKDLEVIESEQLSDQEVEIAGLLYDLSRSIPTVAQSTSAESEEKSRKDLEGEEFNFFSSSIARLEKLSRFCSPLSHELDSKRLRVSAKQEESSCMPPAKKVNANTGRCISELPILVEEGIQVEDELLCNRGAASRLSYQQPETMTRNMIKELCIEVDKSESYTEEERGQDKKPSEDNQTCLAEHTWKQDSSRLSSLINRSELCGQVFCKDSSCLKTSSRSHKGLEGSGISMSKTMLSRLENRTANYEKVNQGKLGEAPVKDDCRIGITDVPNRNQLLTEAAMSPVKREQEDLRLLDARKHVTLMPDLCRSQETLSGVSLVSTLLSRSNSATSNGWMGAFPEQGLKKKAGPLWLSNCLHSGSSSCHTLQLRHAASAQHFARRIRRCATHVHIAHSIQQQQEQQFLHQPFWPTACNHHNPISSSESLQGKECASNKTPFLQSECRHTWAENVGTRMSSSKSSVNIAKNRNCLAVYNNSEEVLSNHPGIKKGCCDLKSVMSTSQLKQSILPSGPNTSSLSFNRSPTQNVSFFNKGAQQGSPASLHVSLSHSYSTQPQVQLQVQCEQGKQPHLHLTPSPQLCSAFLEGNRLGFRIKQLSGILFMSPEKLQLTCHGKIGEAYGTK